ncbi:hypothetical protein LTS17_011399 [Exophiala oligosperma]
MEDDAAFNSDLVLELLNSPSRTVFRTEEERHPWRGRRLGPFNRPLLRLLDRHSGSQPDENGRMRSRARPERLDTFISRQTSLNIHIDHGNWTPTPHISFTDSPDEVERLASLRGRRHRGPFTLTVIDPDERIRKGLPVLNVGREMEEYNVRDPYINVGYSHHYICLWEVTPGEVVGHWKWEAIVMNENWYEEIIIPAFSRAQQARAARNLLNLFDCLSLSNDPTDPSNLFHEERESPSEEKNSSRTSMTNLSMNTTNPKTHSTLSRISIGQGTADERKRLTSCDDMIKMREEIGEKQKVLHRLH